MSTTMRSAPAATSAAVRSPASPDTPRAAPTGTQCLPASRPTEIVLVAATVVGTRASNATRAPHTRMLRATRTTRSGRTRISVSSGRPPIRRPAARSEGTIGRARALAITCSGELPLVGGALAPQALSVRRPAPCPRVQHLDALPGPRAGTPPEHRGGREADETRPRKDDLLEIDEQVQPVRDDRERHEDERLDLEQDDEEDERERRRAERLLPPIRERDVEQAHDRPDVRGASRSFRVQRRPFRSARRPSARYGSDTRALPSAGRHGRACP